MINHSGCMKVIDADRNLQLGARTTGLIGPLNKRSSTPSLPANAD